MGNKSLLTVLVSALLVGCQANDESLTDLFVVLRARLGEMWRSSNLLTNTSQWRMPQSDACSFRIAQRGDHRDSTCGEKRLLATAEPSEIWQVRKIPTQPTSFKRSDGYGEHRFWFSTSPEWHGLQSETRSIPRA